MSWIYWILMMIILIITTVLMVGCGSCFIVLQIIKRLFRVTRTTTIQSTEKDIFPIDEEEGKLLNSEEKAEKFKNFCDLFKFRSRKHAKRVAYLWLDGASGEEEERLTFDELYRICLGYAQDIIVGKFKLKKGDRVIILLPPGLSYNIAFLSCLLCGVVPVPVYPPKRYKRDTAALIKICKNSEAKYIISTQAIHYKTQMVSYLVGNFKPSAFNWVPLPELHTLQKKYKSVELKDFEDMEFEGMDVAYVQYTSGTENDPKGCEITHERLLHALHLSFRKFEPQNVNHFSICIFHPPYHDIGLFLGVCSSIYTACTTIMFSPDDFLKKPVIWLKALRSYKPLYSITLPQFMDHLCNYTTAEERKEYPIPKNCIFCVGGQEISPLVMGKFANMFSCKNIVCGYGLSECTLAISSSSTPKLKIISVDRFEFLNKGVAKVIPNDTLEEKIEFVSCGKVLETAKYAIVDPTTSREVPNNHVGELYISDKTVIEKYLNDEELDKVSFDQRFVDIDGKETEEEFFRTGDMCFEYEDELYFCSRKCDMIDMKKGGFAIIPKVFEKSVNHSHPFIKSSVGFTLDNYKGSEVRQLIVVVEIDNKCKKKYFEPVYESINNDLKEEYGLIPARIVLVKEGSIPFTSSHKKSRSTCKKLFLMRKLKMNDRKDNTALLGKLEMQKKLSFDGLDDIDELTMNAEGGKGLGNYIFTKLDHISDFDKKHMFIMDFIQERVKKVVDVENIDVTQPLNSYGLSSMMAIQLTNELSMTVGKKISATLLFNYPTVEKLALFLETQVFNLRQKTTNIIGEILGRDKRKEEIAVIGIGCRFSGGVDDVSKYWELLKGGKSGIIEVPKDRWNIDEYYDPNPEEKGKMYTRRGGFLQDVDKFDPTFFGISPREAESMDPQQRILLEISWNCFENAGIIPKKMFESRTGVFIAASSYDYTSIVTETKALNPEKYDVDFRYIGTGCSGSVLAGRISYVYGFQGPALTIDTACSSSLVTCHYAANALQNGECDMALAGGVNLTIDPKPYIAFTKTRMLSPDGNCKTFDDSANGYVRGEGCGLVLLKRLSDAIRDGDRVIGILRSSCINQDGRSAGITAPNGLSQEAVISTAIMKGNIHPNDIDYVEAHGTGTSLGDPIEVQSLIGVFGNKGRSTPLIVGSVKTNIGHCESAAGIAGAIKILLSLKNQTIPRHLNLKKLNHRIPPINQVPMFIPYLENYEWEYNPDRKRFAGVSSFGFSGTNSHVIFEEAPYKVEVEEDEEEEEDDSIFCISAQSKESLNRLIVKYDDFLEEFFEDISSLKNLCFTQNVTRTHFKENRVAIHTSSLSGLHSIIKNLVKNPGAANLNGVFRKKKESAVLPKVVFFFTGQGSQYHNMSKRMYEREPEFKKWMDKCDSILKEITKESILSVIFGKEEENKEKMKSTKYVQPALFAIEYSMTKVWEKYKIVPDILLGHSLGEVVAACVARVMSLEDGLKLIVARARFMDETVRGAMAAVFTNEEKVREVINSTRLDVSVAGLNGETNTVISGSNEDIDGILEHFKKMGIKFRKLDVSHAFHSKMMEDILDQFEKEIRRIEYSIPVVPIVSNLYGEIMDDEKLQNKFDFRYWRKHIRNPVQFLKGIKCLVEKFGDELVFIEVGPQSHLCSMASRILGRDNPNPIYVESFKKDRYNYHNAICEAYAAGLPFDWEEYYNLTMEKEIKKKGSKVEALVVEKPKYRRIKFDLPVYQFQKKSYWIYKGRKGLTFGGDVHPLLGRRYVLPTQIVFQQEVGNDLLSGHKIFGHHILPSTGYLDIALSAVAKVYENLPENCIYVVESIGFEEPIKFSDEKLVIQCVCKPAAKAYELEIFTVSMVDEERQWKSHSSSTISFEEEEEVEGEGEDDDDDEETNIVKRLKKRIDEKKDVSELYENIYDKGYHYNETFRNLKELYVNEETREGLGMVELHEDFKNDDLYTMHPALCDSALHGLIAVMGGGFDVENEELFLPISYKTVRFYSKHKNVGKIWVHIHDVDMINDETGSGNLTFYTPKGDVVCEVERFLGRKVSKDLLNKILGSETKMFYDIDWEESMEGDPVKISDEEIKKIVSREEREAEGTILIVNDGNNMYGQKLQSILERINLSTCLIDYGEDFEKVGDNHYTIKPSEKGHYLKLLKNFKQVTRLCHMSSISDREIVDDTTIMNTCGSLMFWIQSLLESRFLPKLCVVTSGIFSTNVFPSAIWGMARTISLELADMKCIRVDLPLENEDGNNIFYLIRELFINHEKQTNFFENEIWYTEERKRMLPKLISSKQFDDFSGAEVLKFDPKKNYFISGGFGGIGLAVAEFLAQKGVKKIILIGRSKPKESILEKVKKIAESNPGVTISGKQGDVCKLDTLQVLFKENAPVGGIIHCAGVWRDAFIMNQNWDDFLTVMKPKVEGSWNLHKISLEHKETLDHFILFSSASSIFGSPGQTNYSGANGFMDHLAIYRKSLNLPALSINWGAWGEIGLAAKSKMSTSKFGVIDIIPSEGLDAMERVMKGGNAITQIGVFKMNWLKFLNSNNLPISSIYTKIKDEVNWRPKVKASSSKEYDELVKKLLSISDPKKRSRFLISKIQTIVANALNSEVNDIDVRRPLMEMGMDSMTAMEISNTLQATVGMKFPATLLFDYPSIEKLAGYLIKKMVLVEGTEKKTTKKVKKRVGIPKMISSRNEPIAVIGLACRFPSGDLDNNDEHAFWKMLNEGRHSSIEIPGDRFDLEEYFDKDGGEKKMYTRHGTFVNNPFEFDPKFFGMTAGEAVTMDPQQRLLLEVSYKAMENACLKPFELEGTKTGVFIGNMFMDYKDIVKDYGAVNYAGTGNHLSVMAGRVSYCFGFQGPVITLDTACSSSLVSTHVACQSLRNMECNLAIAGGVNLLLNPYPYISECSMRMLSPEGFCKTFDDGADGYLRGEGCGIVVLKRLSDAKRDGDRILALMRGSAVNHDGKSAGLTAPNGESQERVINSALNLANLSPKDICFIEAHGTGTPLGDPIELVALSNVFKNNKTPLLVGSVKTNIGHTEGNAGIGGVIKMILQLKHEKIPKHLNIHKLNTHIPPLDQLNLKITNPEDVMDKSLEWKRDKNKKRIAGVSSFGFSGTNAHMIIEEAPESSSLKVIPEDITTNKILCISAKSLNSLKNTCLNYIEYIDKNVSKTVNLRDLCHTANTKKDNFSFRVSVFGKTKDEVIKSLYSFVTENESDEIEKNRNAIFNSVGNADKKMVFFFTGQGSQYCDMTKEMYEKNFEFRKSMDKCNEILKEYLDDNESILDIIFNKEKEKVLNSTKYSQPAIFIVEYSICQVWKSLGIVPDIVIGHSLGEVVAACVCGVMSLRDGLKLIVLRAKYMVSTDKGSMAAIFTGEDVVVKLIEKYELKTRIFVAGLNGQTNTVVSGTEEDIDFFLEKLNTVEKIKYRKLVVSNAFHSKLMDPILDPFYNGIKDIDFSQPEIPIVSNLYKGEIIDENSKVLMNAIYWKQHIRNPVQFLSGIETLVAKEGTNLICLEVGPTPHLSSMTKRILSDPKKHKSVKYLHSFFKGKDSYNIFTRCLSLLYCNDMSFNWERYFGQNNEKVPSIVFEPALPYYTFDKENYNVTPFRDRVLRKSLNINAWERSDLGDLRSDIKGTILVLTAGTDSFSKQFIGFLQSKRVPMVVVVLSDDQKEGIGFNEKTKEVSISSSVRKEDFEAVISHEMLKKLPKVAHIVNLSCLKFDKLEKKMEDLEFKDEAKLIEDSISFNCMTNINLIQVCSKLNLFPKMINITKNVYNQKSMFLDDEDDEEFGEEDEEEEKKESVSVLQSYIWGLGKCINLENPTFKFKLIDISDGQSNETIFNEITNHASDDESCISYLDNERYVMRLKEVEVRKSRKFSSYELKKNESFLITGGCSGLGFGFCKYLIKRKGVKSIILVGRSGVKSKEIQMEIENLKSVYGCEIYIERGDISKNDDVFKILNKVKLNYPKLNGIIHCAGIFDNCLVGNQTKDRFLRLHLPKVYGTIYLHKNLKKLNMNPEHFIMFSSIVSVFGTPGNASYCSSNSFLDIFSFYRPLSKTINWGLWGDIGGVTTAETFDRNKSAELLKYEGQGLLTQRIGFKLFEQIHSNYNKYNQICAAIIHWNNLRRFKFNNNEIPLIKNINVRRIGEGVDISRSSITSGSQDKDEEEEEKEKLSPLMKEFIKNRKIKDEVKVKDIETKFIQDNIVSMVENLLEEDLEDEEKIKIDINKDLVDYGVNSIHGLTLRNSLSKWVGVVLPINMAFTNPNIFSIANFIYSQKSEVMEKAEMIKESRGKKKKAEKAGSEEALPKDFSFVNAMKMIVKRYVANLIALVHDGKKFKDEDHLYEIEANVVKTNIVRNKINEEFKIDIPVEEFFKGPTILKLSNLILMNLFPDKLKESELFKITKTANSSVLPASLGYIFNTNWLQCVVPRKDAKLRMILTPPAGMNTSFFREIIPYFPETIELVILHLPGRTSRLMEPLFNNMMVLAKVCVKQIGHVLKDKPYVFFGHCMGGQINYELFCEIRRQKLPPPKHFFVFSAHAPHIANGLFPQVQWNDDQIVEFIKNTNGGVLPKALENKSMNKLVLGIMRADLNKVGSQEIRIEENGRIWHNFLKEEIPKLDIDVTSWGGGKDEFVLQEYIEEWKNLITGKFQIEMFPEGDHYSYVDPTGVLKPEGKMILGKVVKEVVKVIE